MRLRLILPALLLAICLPSHAQKVRGIFSLSDWLTRNSYLGHAGREYLKPIPPKPSTFEPLAFDPALPAGNIGADGEFVLDLLDRGLREDALVLLGEGNYAPGDSLSFLRGLALFDDRQFQAADRWLSSVTGPLCDVALFYDVVAKTHLDRAGEALEALGKYSGEYPELAALQKSGLALIGGDLDAFKSYSEPFAFNDYRLTDSENTLKGIAASLQKSRRSPALAALMSAVLPGSGKVYAGQTGPGVASFLAVGSLAAITAEQWKHHGAKDWRTIVAGSICGIFYIGNIYGSWVSVSIQRQNIQDETKALVLYNISIPLGSFFR
ncbi:MAG: hypothetical protein J6W94_06575 [Bacteroidales bacterium]|nr:hypothetical protein [Bacteroidales bacterium]